MKILISDDSSILRKKISKLLSRLNDIEILGQAANFVETVRMVHELKPDVVVLDIYMPNGNGLEALKEIRKMDFIPLVIIFTNFVQKQMKRKCLETGADFFFDKSTEFDRLVDVLEQAARK